MLLLVIEEEDSETVAMIVFVGFDDGYVKLKLQVSTIQNFW